MIASPDWVCLSEFEQFALLVHAHDSQHRLMAMIVAYCDESEDIRDPSVYTVSALLGGTSSPTGVTLPEALNPQSRRLAVSL